MGLIAFLDTILVPFSFLLMLGYHGYLWCSFKNKPSQTTIGIDSLRRKSWLSALKKGNDDKKNMLVIQKLEKLTNGNHIYSFNSNSNKLIIGSINQQCLQSKPYAKQQCLFWHTNRQNCCSKIRSGCVFLLVSFMCSSMGLGYMIDANFLLNIPSIELPNSYAEIVFERGYFLSLIGNRVLCITFPLVVWLFGPLPVALSSMALVWALYELDFSV